MRTSIAIFCIALSCPNMSQPSPNVVQMVQDLVSERDYLRTRITILENELESETVRRESETMRRENETARRTLHLVGMVREIYMDRPELRPLLVPIVLILLGDPIDAEEAQDEPMEGAQHVSEAETDVPSDQEPEAESED